MQEIKTTASLHHPNILPLFDSGEADSFVYYVMPYVEGESLRDRLRRERQLPIEDTVALTKALAAALDYAHKRGVIHRDIKPENILLQEGVVLMADFGIALAVKAAGGERLTETGLSIGTPAYMSPEQIVGQRDLDARSDVYSLACVTYEMLAGDPPFVASSAQAVIAKHIADPPPPITTMRPSVRPVLAHALTKALQKTPADRYESAGQFATALTTEEIGEERATKSVVVLPFLNRSADPDDEYFSDGLTDEVICDLSRVSALKVIPRNSAMAMKRTTRDTPHPGAGVRSHSSGDRHGAPRRPGDRTGGPGAGAGPRQLPRDFRPRAGGRLQGSTRDRFGRSPPRELRPGDGNVLLEIARYSLAAGAVDSKEIVDRLVSTDPLTPQSHLAEAMYLGLFGPRERAAAPAFRAIELEPGPSWVHAAAAWWIALAGRRTEAVEILERVSRHRRPSQAVATFLWCALVGDEAGALEAAPPEMEASITNEFLLKFMAEGWTLLDRKAEALRALEAAIRFGFINHPHLVSGGGFLGRLVDNPDYQALAATVESRWKAAYS